MNEIPPDVQDSINRANYYYKRETDHTGSAAAADTKSQAGKEYETTGRNKIELVEALRIMGFTSKPTMEDLNEKATKLKELNDPSKGGSSYISSKVIASHNCIKDAIRKNVTFPTSSRDR